MMQVRSIVLLAAFFASMFVSDAPAQELTSTDIVNALDPHTSKTVLMRSWKKRGVTVQAGTKADAPPSVNLYVNFAYDSAELLTDSEIYTRRSRHSAERP